MKNILKIVLFLFLFFGLIGNSFAKTYTNKQIDRIYDKFIEKIEKKYDSKKEIKILSKLDIKLKYILKNRKLKNSTKKIILRLDFLNSSFIKKFDTKIDSNKLIKFKDLSIIDNSGQYKIERIILSHFKDNSNNFKLKSYINSLKVDYKKKFFYTNSKTEFEENGEIFKFIFSKYYKITSSNYTQFKRKNGVIVYSDNFGYIFLENYEIEKKIKYSDIKGVLLGVVSDEKKYLKEDNTYFYFKFSSSTHISDIYGFYKSDLVRFGYNPDNTLLYKDNKNKFNFVSKYDKIKLVENKYIEDIKNKSLFLKILSSDFVYLNKDYINELQSIKELTNRITKDKNNKEKISIIYNWILNNINYTKEFKLTDYRIFSGLETYKNKNGVCEGYIKLMTYMLLYADINDVEDIRGFVIDAKDFPKIGHAWLRIGDKYYDPTFDDPIGAKKAKIYSEYKYFALPKNLFYTNRFKYGELPEYLKTLSLEKRKKIIFNNLSKISDNYRGDNYLILKPFEFRKKYNLELKQKLTISDLKNIIKYYYVDDYKFYNENGIKKYITSIVYYTIDDNNIENVLYDNLNYNIDGLYLFKWKDGNGKISYRLTNDIVIK